MSATLAQLLRVHSRAAKACLVYLERIVSILSEQPLLRRFGRSLDEGGLRIPLQVEPFDAARLRDRHAQEELERDNLSMRAGDPEAERRLYAHRSALDDEDAKERRAKPEPLDPLLDTLEVAMLLGDPGGGKSECLKGLAVRTARRVFAELKDHRALVEDIRLPVFAELPTVARYFSDRKEEKAMRTFARECLHVADADRLRAAILKAALDRLALDNKTERERCGPALRRIWRDWQQPHSRGRPRHAGAIVLLDAWDEIADRHRTAEFKSALLAFSREPSARIVATSRIVGFESGVLDAPASSPPGAPRRELVILPFRAGESEKFIREFFPAGDTAVRLIQDLRTKPMVLAMLQNPLLATLVSLAFDPSAPSPVRLPAKRAAVYHAVIRRLFGDDEARRKSRPCLPEEAIVELETILRRLAFHFFPDEEFDTEKVIAICRQHRPQRGSKLAAHLQQSSQTLFDCLLASALLTRQAEGKLKFLHLTFQEYFAADRLAEAITAEGWDAATVPIRGRRTLVPVRIVIDRKAWHPRWREVIALTVGQLDPKDAPVEPLIETLMACEDSIHYHRLCLATLCLAQARTYDHAIGGVAAQLGEAAWALVDADDAWAHIDSHLGEYFGVANTPLGNFSSTMEMLATALRDQSASKDIQARAVNAVRRIGATAATPEILAALSNIIRDSAASEILRRRAASAVRGIGSAACTPEILSALAAVLSDSMAPYAVHSAALDAISDIGSQAVTPAILTSLAKIIGGPAARQPALHYGDIAGDAVRTIERIGAPAATPEFLSGLAASLRNTDDESLFLIDDDISKVLAAIGAGAATPAFLGALADILLDPSASDARRSAAADAVASIGKPAGTPAIHAALTHVLRDPAAADAKRLSAIAMQSVGGIADTPEILAALADSPHRRPASDTPRATSSTPEILATLADNLRWGSDEIRKRAAMAVRVHGVTAATPEIIGALADILRDPSACNELRKQSAEAVAGLGANAGTPEILSALAIILRDSSASDDLRIKAANLAGRLAATAMTPEILAAVASILRNSSGSDRLRQYAAMAAGQIGPLAATPEILTALAGISGDPAAGKSTREWSAEIMRDLAVVAGKPEMLDRLASCRDPRRLRYLLRRFVNWRWFDRGGDVLVRVSVEELSKLPPADER